MGSVSFETCSNPSISPVPPTPFATFFLFLILNSFPLSGPFFPNLVTVCESGTKLQRPSVLRPDLDPVPSIWRRQTIVRCEVECTNLCVGMDGRKCLMLPRHRISLGSDVVSCCSLRKPSYHPTQCKTLAYFLTQLTQETQEKCATDAAAKTLKDGSSSCFALRSLRFLRTLP